MKKRSGRKSANLNEAIGCALEPLESRCLLSVSLSSRGVLYVTGTHAGDRISLSIDHHNRRQLDVFVNRKMTPFTAKSVRRISVNAGAGNDNIILDHTVPGKATLLGGTGDDTITGGGADDDVNGGNGDDHCNFGDQSGVAFDQVPAAVQSGLSTLAQGATIDTVHVFKDDGQTYYGAMVMINNGKTRIVVDANGNPVSDGNHNDNGDDEHHGERRFGSLVSVDSGANTITVNLNSEHGAASQQTFTLDPSVTVTVDGKTAALSDLPAGAWISLQFSQTAANTVTGIKAFGKRVEGTASSVDSGANTITVDTEHSGSQTYNVASDATIMVNGVAKSLADIHSGDEVKLKFSADGTTVISIFVGSEDNGGDGHGGGDQGGDHQGDF